MDLGFIPTIFRWDLFVSFSNVVFGRIFSVGCYRVFFILWFFFCNYVFIYVCDLRNTGFFMIYDVYSNRQNVPLIMHTISRQTYYDIIAVQNTRDRVLTSSVANVGIFTTVCTKTFFFCIWYWRLNNLKRVHPSRTSKAHIFKRRVIHFSIRGQNVWTRWCNNLKLTSK